jgi:hypothetical protein
MTDNCHPYLGFQFSNPQTKFVEKHDFPGHDLVAPSLSVVP